MEDTILEVLESSEKELWLEYQKLREKGLRKDALKVLEEFTNRLKLYSQEKLERWVYSFCQSVCTNSFRWDNKPRIPQSLFERVVFPELLKGYKAKKLPYARWLVQISGNTTTSYERLVTIGFPDINKETLLEEAIALDPDDLIAQEELLSQLDSRLRYTVHEVPTGILDESDAFRRTLTRFIELATLQGKLEQYQKRISNWSFHCKAWEDYCKRVNDFKGYKDYLVKQHGLGERNWRI